MKKLKYVLLLVCALFLLLPLGGAASSPRINIEGIPNYFLSVYAGYEHTCGITLRDSTMCWGRNDYGQLGIGGTDDSPSPIRIETLKYLSAAGSGGENHTCAITFDGDAYCWGDNVDGQLGSGDNESSDIPVLVSGGMEWAQISAGILTTCGVTTSGAAYCWGSNSGGQIGAGYFGDPYPNVPTAVSGLGEGTVQSISVGEYYACALTTGGGVKCWGKNDYGQLGIGNYEDQHTPVDVTGLTSGVVSIATGSYHTCALTSGGGVKCWGNNYDGQLGDGKAENYSNVPVDVTGLSSGVETIAAGGYHSCALTTEGAAKCWGYNSQGQLGDNSNTMRTTPVNVFGLNEGVSGISTGYAHTCAVVEQEYGDGIKCWGSNYHGELGTGDYDNSWVPVDVISDVGIIKGEVHVMGGPTGPIGVAAFLSLSDTEPFSDEYPLTSGDSYELWYIEQDEYYVLAYLDVDGSGEDIDWDEPYAWYDSDGDGNPDPVSVPVGEGVDGINLSILGAWFEIFLPLVLR